MSKAQVNCVELELIKARRQTGLLSTITQSLDNLWQRPHLEKQRFTCHFARFTTHVFIPHNSGVSASYTETHCWHTVHERMHRRYNLLKTPTHVTNWNDDHTLISFKGLWNDHNARAHSNGIAIATQCSSSSTHRRRISWTDRLHTVFPASLAADHKPHYVRVDGGGAGALWFAL